MKKLFDKINCFNGNRIMCFFGDSFLRNLCCCLDKLDCFTDLFAQIGLSGGEMTGGAIL